MNHFSSTPSQKLKLRWILLLVMALFIIILAWPNPASGSFPAQVATLTPSPVALATATPIPSEFLQTADQTSGIICGSIVLVLIILGGTVGILRTRNGRHKT